MQQRPWQQQQQQQGRPQHSQANGQGHKPFHAGKPQGPANGAGPAAHSRPAFVPPPHARQLQQHAHAQPGGKPSMPPQRHAQPATGSGKTVFFPAHANGTLSDDDEEERRAPSSSVDDLLAGGSVLPRTIAFKKSSTPFSSAPTLPPRPAFGQPMANGAPRPPQQQQQGGKPSHAPQQNGFHKSPAAGTARPSHTLSPSAKQRQLQQQQQRPNSSPAASASIPSSGVQPIVRCKDPNEFRWPKRYLYPSTSVSTLLRSAPFAPIGCGLHNLGNTCFLNAVLQALAYTPPLVTYMRRKEHSKSCKVRTPQTPDQFCLFCALESTCNAMGSIQKGALAPKQIVGHLRAISRHFRLGRQEDSHEFLRFVQELLQKNDLAAYGGAAVVKDVRIQETTALFGIFGGYFRSQVRCLECGYRSNTFDAFLDLSLELNHVASLQQALGSFTRPEKLDKDNLYNCSRCKKKVRAEKQLTIFKAPTVLCIQLKRFQFAHQFGGKINKPIEFRERLQLESYMSDGSAKTGYSLYAVLVHSGHSVNSGHYYCYVKSSGGQWYLMDDSSVRQVGLQHVLEQRAYILFYVRTAVEALPIAAPSPGVSPAMAPANMANAASKIAQFNLEAAAKKFASGTAAAAHAQGAVNGAGAPAAAVKPAPAPAAAAVDTEGDSDEGDSDEDMEQEEDAKSPSASSGSDDDDSDSNALPLALRKAKAQMAAKEDADDLMSEDEDDDDLSDDDMSEAMARAEEEEFMRSRASARNFVRRVSMLNSMSLNLHPWRGGAMGFGGVRAFLSHSISNRKRRRDTMYEDAAVPQKQTALSVRDNVAKQLRDNGVEPVPKKVDAKKSPSPSLVQKHAEAEQPLVKRQRTAHAHVQMSPAAGSSVSTQGVGDVNNAHTVTINQVNHVHNVTHVTNITCTHPQSRVHVPQAPQPVYWSTSKMDTEITTLERPAASLTSAPAASPAASASAATPKQASAAPAPSPPAAAASSSSASAASASASAPSAPSSSPSRSGPIVVAREAFDPRLLTHAFNSSQYGSGVSDWETTTQQDTSAKYAIKMAQDKARASMKPKQKEKDQWDQELDKGHVRKTKTGKSTAITSDGSGAASANAFQAALDARTKKRAEERSGQAPSPHAAKGGSFKKKGAQHGLKAKGFRPHRERNAEKREGKGRKGPRDFTA